MLQKMSGGEAVVSVMAREGVKKVFCVPGESYLDVMDALYLHPEIELISARHEGGASFMAEGYAKASGEVGVCMATRGVGAANLAIGIHTAYQDSTPLVAMLGQVERPFKGKEAFQEVDLAAWFSHLCKWTVEIDQVERIPELLHRAFYIARSGRPGPVVVSLPHDMLEDVVELLDSYAYRTGVVQPDEALVEQAVNEIARAERPVLIVGGGVTRSGASELVTKFAEALQLPVVASFRRFDAFPNTHPHYAGWLGFGTPRPLLSYIHEADLVIALGTRFSQVTTQDYSLLRPDTRLIHIDVEPEVLGKVYAPTLPILSDAKAFVTRALERVGQVEVTNRQALIEELHTRYLSFSTTKQDYSDEYVDMDGLLHDLNTVLPDDALITNDAGNFFGWLSRYRRFTQANTYIGPTSGAMGYGLPAAIGAKSAHPEKMVVSFSGDGGFMMTMAELETAVRCQIPTLSIVVNNNMYGTIRAHQEKTFPNRVIGTDLTNPNFAEIARLFGGYGERVTRNEDFLPAWHRAIASGKPAVIEVLTNPSILSASQPKH